MEIKIRKSTFDVLYKNILTVNYVENWELFETNDKSKNPLVVLNTKKTKKLIKLCKRFVNNSNDIFDLEIGAIKGFIIYLEMEMKHCYIRGKREPLKKIIELTEENMQD